MVVEMPAAPDPAAAPAAFAAMDVSVTTIAVFVFWRSPADAQPASARAWWATWSPMKLAMK